MLFFGLCRCRGSNSIRMIRIFHFLGFDLMQICIEDNLLPSVIEIIVFCGKVIDINCTELSHNHHISVDNGFGSHLCVSAPDNPLFEGFARHERILGHGANGLSSGAKILG